MAAAALGGCGKERAINVVSSPYESGVAHSEPVFYNGRHYQVGFAFNASANAYDMTVSGKGRALGGEAGDRKIVESIATSTVRHFACSGGQKGYVVAGTTRHTGSAWSLQTRCS
jgi:hypothetical protein